MRLTHVRTLYSNGILKDITYMEDGKRAPLLKMFYGQWVNELFCAARWLHRLGIVHCDIKPAVESIHVPTLISLECLFISNLFIVPWVILGIV